jgi:hypothetical protein
MPGLIETFSLLLAALWQYIQSPVAQDSIRSIVTSLAFVTSFITYVLANVISRKIYIRLQSRAIAVVFLLFSSLVLGIAELVQSISLFGISNFLLKLSFVFWIPGLILLMALVRNMLSVDRASFKKPKASMPLKSRIVLLLRMLLTNRAIKKPEARFPLKSFQDIRNRSICKFGLSCVDKHFKVATLKKRAERLYFPILLVAEKYFRPWRMAARFAVAGLAFEKEKEGLIYFAFNQPADIVIDQLAKRLVNVIDPKQDPEQYWKPLNGTQGPKKFEQVVVIDCHSKWLEKDTRYLHEYEFPEAHKQVQILYSDPRDPFNLANKYKQALEMLLGKNIQRIRVIYDSVSDFLIYSDPQLALQFIKHNMVWEDRMKISSLYVYIPGVPQNGGQKPVDEKFLKWNSYCVVEFKHKEQEPDTLIIEGLFPERIQSKVKCMPLSDWKIIKPKNNLWSKKDYN